MSHFIIKLVSGEFVYGKVKSAETKMLTIENPLVWEDYISQDGSAGSAMVKYITGSDEKVIPIATNAVVSMAAMSPTFGLPTYNSGRSRTSLNNCETVFFLFIAYWSFS